MSSTPTEPGAVVKALRLKKGLKLRELSERTGLLVSALSKLENGKMSLTYDKLVRIASSLEVDIGELFAPRASTPAAVAPTATKTSTAIMGRRSVTRAGEGAAVETRVYHHLYAASELLQKRFHPIFGEVHARSIEEFGELIRHPGEEFGLVLEGSVTFHTDTYAPVRLETGDSVYFDSGMGHAYIASSPGRCRILSISSSDEVEVHAAVKHLLVDKQDSAPAARAGKRRSPVRVAGRKVRVSKRRA